MYKNYTKNGCMPPGYIKKILLVMKITTFLIIAALMQVSAAGLAQKVTLIKKDITLKEVFKEINKQTGYNIFGSDEQINKKIDANFQNAGLLEVLNKCLENTSLTYSVEDKTIIIKKKEESFIDNLKNKIKSELAQVTVSGKVVDELGNPMLGVTVRIKDTQAGIITDKNGLYSITVPNENTILTFSFVGFEPQELKAKDIVAGSNVILKASSTNLREVVVGKGAYDEKREFLTGNVGTVTAKEIAIQPVSNVLQALEGKIPGLVITQSTGTPGGAFNVQIRGQNSLSQGSDPFYVIDGVPYDSKLATLGINTALHGGSPLDFINPYDIEKIEVLKDADATAIYGSRGANGVILITTKKGQVGTMRVNVSANSGVSSPGREIQLLNTQQYLAVRHQAFKNDGALPGSGDYDVNGTWDTTRNTNWIKELVQKPASYTDVQTSVSGAAQNK
ncbi:MAG: TonB-dependent receptor plug [Mucilaginibacter sp.]|nr:TonB-dependent receptor plug [Mucilaginibacter sp.]